MNKKYAVLALVLLAVIMMAPVSASAAASQGVLSVPISGTALTKATGITAPITGTFNITGFAVQNGKLVATGTVNFLLNGVQHVLQVVVQITNATGSCPILTLDIGAIHLDLLGLVVDLAPVHLTITAQSGPGNLLGNLLCAIADLLNNNGGLGNLLGGLLNQLATLLNQLLGQL